MIKSLALLLFLSSTQNALGQNKPFFEAEEPKPLGTQNELAIKEGLKKIGLLPYFIGKKIVKLASPTHENYMIDFFFSDRVFLEMAEDDFEIYAHEHYYVKTLSHFFYPEYMKGKDYSTKSCEKVCPESFSILGINPEQLKETSENFLSFRNQTEDFADSYIKQSGYCWGYSTVMDDFHYLGFFDPENKHGQVVPEGNKERIEFYKKLIDQVVLKEKATIIPGFQNLRQLAEVPEFKAYLKIKVAKKWAKNAVKLRSIINVTLDGHKMKLEKTKEFIDEVKARLIAHQTPRIIFAALGDSTWSHVLNIYGMKLFKETGVHRIYVFESNYYPELKSPGSYYIDIDKEGNATYDPIASSRVGHNKVGRIKFSFEEEDAEVRYLHQMQKMCIKLSGCQK